MYNSRVCDFLCEKVLSLSELSGGSQNRLRTLSAVPVVDSVKSLVYIKLLFLSIIRELSVLAKLYLGLKHPIFLALCGLDYDHKTKYRKFIE